MEFSLKTRDDKLLTNRWYASQGDNNFLTLISF